MMETFAYEIGAVFLLAALLIGGSFLRGFFSHEILRLFKLAATGLILAAAGLWFYRVCSIEPVTPSAQSVSPAVDPVKQAAKAKRAESLRESDRKALAAAMAEDAAKSDVPAHLAAPNPAAPSSPSRGKRVAKSVGRALHLVPKSQP